MINLLPESIKEDMIYGRKNRQITNWIITSLFGVLILLLVAGFGRLTIQTARNQTLEQKQGMESQLEKANYNDINESYGDYVNGLSNVKKLYGQQILYTRLIRKLGTLLPSGARLTTISISDKDRAIGLNFDNDTDGLGPVIQLNLTDQSKQVADKTTIIFNEALQLPIVGDITTDADKQSLEFYVNAPADKATKLKHSLQTGGDLAFDVISSNIKENLTEYNTIVEQNALKTSNEDIGKILSKSNPSVLQVRGYKVDNARKYVDFTVRTNNLNDAKSFGSKLTSYEGSLFIETYSFLDSNYTTKQKCTDSYSKKVTCTGSSQSCKPTATNGCQYIVRAYYDEIYSSNTISEQKSQDGGQCTNSKCTHKISVQYSQLFKNVDLNRVSACTVDTTTNTSTCPVEMRAEFSDDAKFYLINLGATK